MCLFCVGLWEDVGSGCICSWGEVPIADSSKFCTSIAVWFLFITLYSSFLTSDASTADFRIELSPLALWKCLAF